jgi:hypothetical protein
MLKRKVARRNPLSLKPIRIYPIVDKLASFRKMRVFALRLPRAERGSLSANLSAVVLTKAEALATAAPLLSKPSEAEPSFRDATMSCPGRKRTADFTGGAKPRRPYVLIVKELRQVLSILDNTSSKKMRRLAGPIVGRPSRPLRMQSLSSV